MDSFSEENDSSFNRLPPDCQSTPKNSSKRRIFHNNPSDVTPKRTKLECRFCGKLYVSKHYFDKHVESHSTDDNNNNNAVKNTRTCDDTVNNDSVAADITYNVTFSAMNDSATSVITRNQFKTPAPPKKKKVTKRPRTKPFVCTYCLRGYVCSNSYKTHMRTHAMQDGAALFPKADSIVNKAADIAAAALVVTAKAPSAEASGVPYRQLVGDVVSKSSTEEWEIFCTNLCAILIEAIDEKKCLLPSALLSLLILNVETLLSDIIQCDHLLSLLKLPECFSEDGKSQFLLEFSLNFVAEILNFISKTFRSRCRPSRPNKVPEIDDEDRAVIFYIGGSIMRGYLRIAYRYRSSSRWQLIALTVKAKLLCDKPSYSEDASWTRSVDRGALLYLNDDCQKFFVALTEIVFMNEAKNGSINYDVVIEQVIKSDLSVMWDQMILDSLPEGESMFLLNDVVRFFCKTCGRGFAKRRLNFVRDKPLISLPTRHVAASKKAP